MSEEAPRPHSLRRHLLAGLLFLAFQGALYLPHLSRGELLLPVSLRLAPPWQRTGHAPARPQDQGGTDKIVFTLPNILHWRRTLAGEASLFWNPDILCGYPFLNTQDTCALYPLNVVFLLDPLDGFLITAILHGWIACFLAWLVLLALGMTAPGALMGGLVYGASGWFLGHMDIINFVQAAAWLPLMVLGGIRVTRDGSLRGVWALALGFLLSFLGGMAQITFIGLFFTGCLVLVMGLRRLRDPHHPTLIRFGMALGAVALGTGLAAPQMLPTYEFSRLSKRRALTARELGERAVGPLELSGLIYPELLGNPAEFDRWQRFEPRTLPPGVTEKTFPPARLADVGNIGDSFMERVVYPGCIPLLLLLIGLAGRERRRALLALLVTAAGFLAAMETPLMRGLESLPFFAFGSPRRFLLVAVMGLAAGAAVGVQSLGAGTSSRRALRAGLILLVPSTLFTLLLLGGAHLVVAPLMETTRSPLTLSPAVERWLLLKSAHAPILLALALAGILLLRRRFRLLLIFLILLTAADLAHFNLRINPGQPREESQLESRLGSYLSRTSSPNARIFRFRRPGAGADLPALPPNLAQAVGVRDAQGYEGLMDGRVEELLDLIQPGIVLDHHLVSEITRRERLDSPILDLLCVNRIVSTAPLDLPLLFADPLERVAVYRRPGALPLATLPRRVRPAATDEEALEILGDPGFDPTLDVVLRVEALDRLVSSSGWAAPPHDGPFPLPVGASSVHLVRAGATSMEFAYRTEAPCLLHVASSYHEEWTAETNKGEILPVLRANHALLAVPLPPGKGRVVLRFLPRAFFWGTLLAGVAILVLLAWTLLAGRRRSVRASSAQSFT